MSIFVQRLEKGRCSKGVDLMLESQPQLIAIALVSAADLDLHVLWMEVLQYHLIHLLEIRCLFLILSGL
jgi:hypothetical protein